MKKKIIYSSALATLLSASSIALAGGPEIIPVEDFFSGLYVGGTGAMHHATLEGNSSINFLGIDPELNPILAEIFEPTTTFAADVQGGSVDGYGGIQGGFGWTFNHVWYLGVQGWGEWGSQSNTNNSEAEIPINIHTPDGAFINQGVLNQSTTIKISNDYGVAAKLGYIVAPRTMVYGKIGASWADIKVTNSVTGNNDLAFISPSLFNSVASLSGSSSSTQNQVGLLLGVGFEQFLYQDIVSLNVEYNYVNYGTTETGPATLFGNLAVTSQGSNILDPLVDVASPVTTQASGSAVVNSLTGGLNFYFGRNWF